MNNGEGRSRTAERRESRHLPALVAAYRDGLGLAPVVLVRDHQRILFDTAANQPGEDTTLRWWCRRAGDAERVAAAATARLQCRASGGGPDAAPASLQEADEAVVVAAKRLAITLYSDEEIAGEAAHAIARMDEEFARLQSAGALKDINRSYRTARMQAASRGEKMPPYAQWINKYRENLLRQLAAALR
jgi:hypothetical protein